MLHYVVKKLNGTSLLMDIWLTTDWIQPVYYFRHIIINEMLKDNRTKQ